MTASIAMFVGGLAIALLTLREVFQTILVPGPARGGVRSAAILVRLALPFARRLGRAAKGPGSRPANSFAPLLLVAATLLWLLCLLFGFGLMMLAMRDRFDPALRGLPDALYVAGSSLLTLGVSEVDARGVARWLILAAALSGFAVITATVAFTLQIQSGLHQREPRVLALAGVAGTPLSGIAILETHAALSLRDALPGFFALWRDWAADVMHSHISYPVLAFFHSADAENDWLAALSAVLDAATLLMAFGPAEEQGAATLLHRGGARTVAQLAALFDLTPEQGDHHDPDEYRQLRARLAAAGFALGDAEPLAISRLIALRGDYLPHVRALAAHLGADRSRLLPVSQKAGRYA